MASGSKDTRSLTFSDGSSNKFWTIELDGSSHTVTYGRIGTAGQTQTKDFADDAAAQKSYDKLVAEKLKKGYTDTASGTAASAGSAATKKVDTTSAAKSAKKTDGKTATADSSEVIPASSVPAAVAKTSVVIDGAREIALDPEDWARAGFRKRKQLVRGAPMPFDLEACHNRLLKLKTATYGWVVKWEDLKLTPAMSAEEAHFWLLAMTTPRTRETKMKEVSDAIRKQKITGEVDADAVRGLLSKCTRGAPEDVTLPLSILLPPSQFFEFLLAPEKKNEKWAESVETLAMVSGFARYVVPYATDKDLDAMRRRIRSTWDPMCVMSDDYSSFPVDIYLATVLGMPDEIMEFVSGLPDDRYTKNTYADHYQSPQWLLFGLASADQVESEWRRLNLRVRSAEDARGLLACTEYSALDILSDSIVAQTNKEKCEELLNVLALVRAPENAVPMLTCQLSAKVPAIARDWLDAYVSHAVSGLIDTAGGRGKLAEAAMDYLQNVKRRGFANVIAAALKAAGKLEAAARVQTEVLDREEKVYLPLDPARTPKPLKKAFDEAAVGKRKPLPTWAEPGMLPPLLIGDRRLNDEQMATLQQVLAATPVTTSHPLLTAVRDAVDKHVRDAFSWKLFQQWQADGCPSAHKWAMGAIGHLGDDGCAMKLTPQVRVWPGESQHARAVFGLECLRAIGSNVALMQLSGIAQKLKFKGLKSKAELFVNEIAEARGLTRSELEDRVIPDCGLDDNGRREFSFGSRSFSFVLGSDLKAMLRDADGKVRGDLPKPGGKDDMAVANASVADWKLMKKQIKEVAMIQAGRLEGAMVTGRRWSPDDFMSLLVQHPLMTHLTQKLIWGAFDSSGKRIATFRVTEERDLADVKDNACDLKKAVQVGIVHALELSDDERSAWGEVLSDYEIVTPFPQLGREIFSLEKDEAKATELSRFKGLKLVAPTLVFTLEKLGWIRGAAMDGGCFDEHSRQFPAADVTAVVGYEGVVGMGYIDPNEMLTLETIIFCKGMRKPGGYGWDKKDLIPLGTVSPIVISEVLADMQVLKGKAK